MNIVAKVIPLYANEYSKKEFLMVKDEEQKSIVQFAMEWGVYMGLYFVVKFVFEVCSMNSFFCNAVSLLMLLCIPVVLYYAMRKYDVMSGLKAYFAQLWMMGIMLFFFASLICSVAEFVFYQYINPGYVAELFDRALALIKESEMLSDTISLEDMHKAIGAGVLPTPLQMVMQSIWSNVFFGSLLSMIVAPFVLRKHKKAS